MKILIATNNKHKAEEIQAILSQHQVFVLEDFNINCTVEETGATFHENAMLKLNAIKAFNPPVDMILADDSGLQVEALNGAPGVHSARYADNNATDKENCNKLLIELEHKPNRNASFICVLATFYNNEYQCFVGEIKGIIKEGYLGENGFGYDPLFIPDNYTKTFAEMSSEEKNEISHRKNALLNLLKAI